MKCFFIFKLETQPKVLTEVHNLVPLYLFGSINAQINGKADITNTVVIAKALCSISCIIEFV